MGRKNGGGMRRGEAEERGAELSKLIAGFLHERANEFSERSDMGTLTGPVFYGFNISTDKEGNLKFETFGNISPNAKTQQKHDNVGAFPDRYLVDVMEKGNEVVVIAEMPGADKNELTILASECELVIESQVKGKKYKKIVQLPKSVDPDTANAQLNNGVLEVTFNKPISSNNSARLNAN